MSPGVDTGIFMANYLSQSANFSQFLSVTVVILVDSLRYKQIFGYHFYVTFPVATLFRDFPCGHTFSWC